MSGICFSALSYPYGVKNHAVTLTFRSMEAMKNGKRALSLIIKAAV